MSDLNKVPSPVVDFMHKRDLPAAVKLDENNHAWEGWSEKTFISRLREKNVFAFTVKVVDTLVGFAIYEVRDSEILLLKFETAREFENSRVRHVLTQGLKERAVKKKKNVRVVFPEERWEIEKYKFFAKEGFASRLKRGFFTENDENPRDGYEFTWNYSSNDDSKTNFSGFSSQK